MTAPGKPYRQQEAQEAQEAMMALFITLLVATVAIGGGGYHPWAVLVLEAGVAVLTFWVVMPVVGKTPKEQRAVYVAQRRAWRRLPFLVRHRGLASFLRVLTFSRFFARYRGAPVEVLPPHASGGGLPEGFLERHVFLFGFPFKRTGIGIPLFVLTLWMLMSTLPLNRNGLEILSPQAHALRAQAESLILPPVSPQAASWSLAPFLTLQSLWLWVAYLALFYASAHLAGCPKRVAKLTLFLFLAGVCFGLYGIGQWFSGLRDLFGADPSTAGLQASSSFGNRNHYAAFMEMLLLCSLGLLGARWSPSLATSGKRALWRRVSLKAQEAGGKLILIGLGVFLMALGLVLSVSRSGISFALVGCGAFALLIPHRRTTGPSPNEIEIPRGERPRKPPNATRLCLALGLIVVGFAVWIGIEPLAHRFELLPGQWESEAGRWQVWSDSWDAVSDFWLTGSGLSTFRYVFPIYRSFGGRIFYSWAHNDYLQALIELGLPGLLLILASMGAVWRRASRIRRKLLGKPPLLVLHAAYCAAATAIALHSLTDFSLHLPANAALLAVVVGVIVGLGEDDPRREESTG